jgi:small subunit ribosomal protein S8
MPTTDPIADFLNRIRNALKARHPRVDIPFSNVKSEIARVLMDCNFIRDYVHVDEGPQGFLRVYLKYSPQGKPVIMGIRRISSPGLRRYVKQDEIPRVLNGLGVSIMTTSKGIMTGNQARKQGLGGEVIAEIW